MRENTAKTAQRLLTEVIGTFSLYRYIEEFLGVDFMWIWKNNTHDTKLTWQKDHDITSLIKTHADDLAKDVFLIKSLSLWKSE